MVLGIGWITVSWQEDLIVRKTRARAEIQNQLLTSSFTNSIAANDLSELAHLVLEAKKADAEIDRIDVTSEELILIATTGQTETGGIAVADDLVVEARRSKRTSSRLFPKVALEVAYPLFIGNTFRGVVRIRYSLERMAAEIRAFYESSLIVAAMAMAIAFALAYMISGRLIEPIRELVHGANEILSGNLEYRVPIHSQDEISILARAWNEVTARLSANIYDLRDKSRRLEESNLALTSKIEEMRSLENLGKVISSMFNLEELLRAIVQNASVVMKSKRCSIVLINERTGEPYIKLGKGFEDRSGKGLDKPFVENLKMRSGGFVTDFCLKNRQPLLVTDIETDPRFHGHEGTYSSKSFLAVPLLVLDRAIGVLSITEKVSGEAYNDQDMALLSVFANHVVIAIENAKLYERLVERERLEKELEIARSIQMNMLPQKYPTIEGFELTGTSIPAKEVGGDYFDFLPLAKDSVAVTFGEVSGKGFPAALMMVMIRSILRSHILTDQRPPEVVTGLNDLLVGEGGDTRMFVTLFYAVIDCPARRMIYTNAGHNYPLVLRQGSDEFVTLEEGGLLVGMFEKAEYEQGSIDLAPGDVILFYTDGIIEAMNENDEMYEFERMCELVKGARDRTAAEIQEVLIRDVQAFAGQAKQYDDMTVIVVKVGAEGRSA